MDTLICDNCKKSFLGWHRVRRGKTSKRRFCSTTCRYAKMRGEYGANYKTGRCVPKTNNYITVLRPGHPRANCNHVLEHVVVVEEAYGPLPDGAEIRHINRDKKDNRLENLVVCKSRKEHMILESQGLRLLDTGSLDLRRCPTCKIAKPLNEFYKNRRSWDGASVYCKPCVKMKRELRKS